MTHFKTILMTAALMAVPSVALAQISTDALKDKAVEGVMDNMTTDDAVIAGTTMIKGGSKEDAAMAIVKNRANSKIESMTGGVKVDEFSKDGVMDAGKEMAMEKVKGSSTTYTDGASLGGVSTGGAMDAGKAMVQDKMIEKATGSSTTYTGGAVDAGKAMVQDKMMEKATGSSTTYTGGAVDAGKAMVKDKMMDKATDSSTTYGMSDQEKAKSMITTGDSYVIQKSGAEMSAPAATMAPVNCPSGTKDAGDGTCMITGDWKP